MIDKELALRNVIAAHALEGLIMTDEEIERGRQIVDGELSIDEGIAEIHRELAADKLANPNLYSDAE